MNYYETLYIVHPALETGRLKDIILSLEESLKNVGGKTLSIDLWGKKRLAYLIDKQKYGTYVQLQFSGEGKCISSFGTELGHNPNILSYLTTLIKEDDLVEQKTDLDTQIAGQSRQPKQINDLSNKENVTDKGISEDKKLIEQNDISSVKTATTESVGEPLKKDEKENISSVSDDVATSSEQSEPTEMNAVEKNSVIVKEAQESIDKEKGQESIDKDKEEGEGE